MNTTRPLLAIACGCEVACAAYAIIRTFQYFFIPEPNPALVMQSVHAGYFWRAWISAYAGGFVALLVGLLAKSEDRVARAALWALPWSAGLLVVQGVFIP